MEKYDAPGWPRRSDSLPAHTSGRGFATPILEIPSRPASRCLSEGSDGISIHGIPPVTRITVFTFNSAGDTTSHHFPSIDYLSPRTKKGGILREGEPETPNLSTESGQLQVSNIESFVSNYNHKSKPFIWTTTADSIIAKIERFCTSIAGTRH